MSATFSEICAKPDTIPGETKKRQRPYDLNSEIYDSNAKTRRVDPYKLGERLGPDLVREMEVYIKPGAMMPSFAIRKELQQRYHVDRRHLYDYFHSRGLRVAKEDRHNNLARSRQTKATAAVAATSGKDAPAPPKKAKVKVAQPALAPFSVNITSHPIARDSKHNDDKPSDSNTVSESSIYAREIRHPSLELELVNELATPSSVDDDPEQYPLPSNDSQSSLLDADDSDSLPPVMTSTPDIFPFNINDWLAERTVADSSTCNHSQEFTFVDEGAEVFSPLEFVKETMDSLYCNYDDFINFDEEDDSVSSLPSVPEVPTTSPIIEQAPDREQFYHLVSASLDSISKTQPAIQQAVSILCQQTPRDTHTQFQATSIHSIGSTMSSSTHLAERNLCSAPLASSHDSVSSIVLAPPKPQPSPVSFSGHTELSPFSNSYNSNHLQTGDRCAYSSPNESYYRSDRFFVQSPSQGPIYQYRTYLPRPSRFRATSAGGGI